MSVTVASSLVVALACMVMTGICALLTTKARSRVAELIGELDRKNHQLNRAYKEVADLQQAAQGNDEQAEALRRQVDALTALRTEQEGIIAALRRELTDGPPLSAPGTIY